MGFYVPVEAFLSTTNGNFFNPPGLGENFQVSVDSGQAYSWEPFFYPLKKLVSRWVKRGFLQFFEYDFPLMGHAKLFCHDAIGY